MFNIKVYVRIRPINDDEITKGEQSSIKNIDYNNSALTVEKDYEERNFSYDGIFGINSKQKDIFEKTAIPVINVREF